MKKTTRFLFLLTLIFLLNGCDIWDDLVDSVSGSGDDTPPPIQKVAAVQEVEKKQEVEEKQKEEQKQEVAEEPEETEHESKFHHTTTGSIDGGKSLVLCPGQRMNFTDCSAGSTSVPFHGFDEKREIYWNMKKVPSGDIVCTKNGRTYRYRADKSFVSGSCR